MRTTTNALLALPAALALTLVGVTGASADESYTMKLTDTMGNDSGSQSTADISIKGDMMTVQIKGTGFTPDSPHAQHFHGSFDANKDFTCPDSSADKDGDGQVNTEEGLPMYGDIVISLTTKGDTSPKSGLAVDGVPEEATNPATCGTVSGAAVGATPTGGVETGNGSTQGPESLALLGLGGLAVVGAGGALAFRRRFAGDS